MLPFFEEHGAQIRTILSDNGREYRGRPDRHRYELSCNWRTSSTEPRRLGDLSRTASANVSTAPFSKSISGSKGRTTWYEAVEEMEKDLDVYLATYNRRRPHQGRSMKRRTPYGVFKAGIARKRTRRPSANKEVKGAART